MGEHWTGERADEMDPIDEAGDESFPASDPPSFTAGHACPCPCEGGAHRVACLLSREQVQGALRAARAAMDADPRRALDSFDVEALVQGAVDAMHLDRGAFDAVLARDADLMELYRALVGGVSERHAA